jgi:hypothetical protein
LPLLLLPPGLHQTIKTSPKIVDTLKDREIEVDVERDRERDRDRCREIEIEIEIEIR